MELLVFGHGGTPVLVFPTSMGRFFEWEGFGMVAALAPQLEAGYNTLYCLDSVDVEALYNRRADPHWRLARHQQYEEYVRHEVLPMIRAERGAFLIVTGASFGAYHAANFTFRHPREVGKLVAMGGAYDIKPFFNGFYSDALYFHNPVDYLANLTDPAYLEPLRRVDVRLLAGAEDFCRASTELLAALLSRQGVGCRLEIWPGAGHDWPWWREMIAVHIV
mgnify:CR=1 FL=1